jgi:hypothetical protein
VAIEAAARKLMAAAPGLEATAGEPAVAAGEHTRTPVEIEVRQAAARARLARVIARAVAKLGRKRAPLQPLAEG